MQELFEKLMRLSRSARDDYTRFQSSVMQRASKPSVEQLAFREDRDVMQQHSMSHSRESHPQNGLTVIHSSDKNCSVQPANAYQHT